MKVRTQLLIPLLITACFLVPAGTTAQIWKNLGKKVEEKVERQASNRLERKIDKAIDKGFDKVEKTADDAVKSDDSKENKKNSTTASSDVTTVKQEPVKIRDVYNFNLGVTYRMQSDNQKATDMTMWLGEKDAIGMSVSVQKEAFMVMQGAQMITFMVAQKKYMALGSGMTNRILNAAAEEADKDPSEEEFSIKKIGTERILNYNCDIYEMTSPDYTSRVWLTRDLGVDPGNFMSAFSAMAKGKTKFPNTQSTEGGLLLKMEGKNTKGKDSVRMEATAVHPDGLKFSTAGYTSLGF